MATKTMQVTLVYAPAPREVFEQSLNLAEGSTAAQALAAASAMACYPKLELDTLAWSVWGRAVDPDQVLQAGDRLALCRALKVDPKIARRERFAQQGSRATGLFAKKKRGVEAGY